MRYLLLLFYFFLLIPEWTVAQRDSVASKMVEFPIEPNLGNNFRLFPLGEKGAVLMLKSSKIEKGKIDFIFSLLDTNLKPQWQRAFPLKFTTMVVAHVVTQESLYLLVSPREGTYEILHLNFAEQSLTKIDYQNIKDYFITKFSVAGDLFFFGGTIKNYPAIIAFNYRTGRKVILSSVNQLKAELVDLEVDPNEEVVSVVLFQDRPANQRGVYINRYDFSGKLLTNFFYKTEAGFRFLSYRAVILNPVETLFIGTFALRGSDQSHGLYSMKVRGEEIVFLKRYPFVEMEHFMYFLPEGKQGRIRRKAEKRRRKGKDLHFQFHTFLQNLQYTSNRIIATLDVFETILDRGRAINYVDNGGSFVGYGSRNDPSLDRFVRSFYKYDEFTPMTIPLERINPNKPFPTEFEYLSTIACAFDGEGELLWDNSFLYDRDISHFIPIHMSRVSPTIIPDSLLMARLFISEEEQEMFQYKITSPQTYTDSAHTLKLPQNTATQEEIKARVDSLQKAGNTKVTIETFSEEPAIQSYEYGGFVHWYGNHFLATGLKELQFNTGIRRQVYFIRKITYLPKKK